MSFARPDLLWLLLLGGPVLLAYIVRLRRRRVVVPYLKFWEEIDRRERLQTWLARLKDLGQLLLSLSVVGLLAWAAAGVDFPALIQSPREFVLILDDTPSMLARDRLSRQAEEAAAFMDRYVTWRDRVARYTFSGSRLESGEAPAVRLGPRPPLRQVVEGLRRVSGTARVIAFTDGCEREFPNIPRIVFGHPVPNLSVAIAKLQPDSVRLDLQNHSRLSMSGALVYAEGREFATIKHGETMSMDKALKAAGARQFRWEPGDAFPIDDAVYVWTEPTGGNPLILFSRGPVNPFLWNGVELLCAEGAFDREQRFLEKPERHAGLASTLPSRCVMMFLNSAPAAPPDRGRYFIISRDGAGLPVGVRRVAENPRPTAVWEGLGLEAAPFTVRRSLIFEVGQGVIPLIESSAGPIAILVRRGGLAAVVLGFSLEDTDIQLTPLFPVLLRRSAHWLTRERLFPESGMAGEFIESRHAIPDEEIELLKMDTGERWTEAVRDGHGRIGTERGPGLYRVRGTSFEEYIAVNFGNADESELSPRVASLPPDLEPAPWWWRIPPWAVATALAVALALLEWWLFFRRS